jgi:hypothetical protein
MRVLAHASVTHSWMFPHRQGLGKWAPAGRAVELRDTADRIRSPGDPPLGVSQLPATP